MNRLYKYLGVFVFGLLLGKQGFAQEVETTDFYKEMKNYDLSIVLAVDTFLADEALDFDENSISWRIVEKDEILGFIGDNYQRFQIHFISIIQNPTNPYEYFAYGKTKVKNNICEFQGIIKIIKSSLYKECDIPFYKQGYAECEVILYEDKKQAFTGFFKGNLTSNFIIDDKGVFRYDALSSYADGFCNNQFIGTWTNYKTKSSKKCHWGDYRIPDCGDLDCGAGLFMVWDEYKKNGWQSYVKCNHGSYPDEESYQKACKEELFEWWK